MGKTCFKITKNWIILFHLYLKHIHKVRFYQSGNIFTQALLVMLVTNIIFGAWGGCIERWAGTFCFLFSHRSANPPFPPVWSLPSPLSNDANSYFTHNNCCIWTFYHKQGWPLHHHLFLHFRTQQGREVCKFSEPENPPQIFLACRLPWNILHSRRCKNVPTNLCNNLIKYAHFNEAQDIFTSLQHLKMLCSFFSWSEKLYWVWRMEAHWAAFNLPKHWWNLWKIDRICVKYLLSLFSFFSLESFPTEL